MDSNLETTSSCWVVSCPWRFAGAGPPVNELNWLHLVKNPNWLVWPSLTFSAVFRSLVFLSFNLGFLNFCFDSFFCVVFCEL